MPEGNYKCNCGGSLTPASNKMPKAKHSKPKKDEGIYNCGAYRKPSSSCGGMWFVNTLTGDKRPYTMLRQDVAQEVLRKVGRNTKKAIDVLHSMVGEDFRAQDVRFTVLQAQKRLPRGPDKPKPPKSWEPNEDYNTLF